MSSSKTFPLLAAILGLGLLLFGAWLLRDRERPAEDSEGGRDRSSLSNPAETGSESEPGESTRDAIIPAPSSQDPVSSIKDAPESGVKLTGKVFFPDGSGAPEASVLAFRGPTPFAVVGIQQELEQLVAPSQQAAVHDLQRFDVFLQQATSQVSSQQATPTPANAEEEVPLAQTRTDGSGSFTLNVQELPVYLDVQVSGYRPAKTLRIEQAGPIRIDLVSAATLRGRVVDPDGRAVARAWVYASVPFDPFAFASAGASDLVGLREKKKTQTDDQGDFELSGVPLQETFLITASHPDFAPSDATRVSVKESGQEGLSLTLQPTASLVVKVQDESGQSVSGARVSFISTRLDLSQATQLKLGGGTRLGHVTDTDGRVSLDGLSQSAFRVEVRHSDWMRSVTREVEVPKGLRVEHVVTLQAGREVSVRLVNALDEDQVVSNAIVRAFPKPQLLDVLAYSSNEAEPWHQGNEQGECQLRGLSDGTLFVEARAKGFTPLKEEIDEKTQALTLKMHPTASIEGIVVSKVSGDPIQEFSLQIRAKRSFSMDFAKMGQDILSRDKTLRFASSDGRFSIQGMDAGTYALTAKALEHASFEAKAITLESGQEKKGVLCFLGPEAVIVGRVFDQVTRLPIQGARVRVLEKSQDRIAEAMGQMFRRSRLSSDQEGRFRIGSLASGTYRLEVDHPEYAPKTVTSDPVLQGSVSPEMEIFLHRGATIFGTVYNSEGDRIPSAKVFISNPQGTRFHSVDTDQEGEYEVTALSAGTYVATLMPDQFSVGSDDMMESISQNMATQNVSVEEGQRYRVDFGLDSAKGDAILEGRITDSGAPVTGAIVSAYHPGERFAGVGQAGAHTTMSKDEGRFRLEGLERGKTMVQVQIGTELMAGSPTLVEEIVLSDGLNRLDLEIPQGAIEGVVIDAQTGEAVSGLMVSLSREESSLASSPLAQFHRLYRSSSMTDAKGKYRLAHLGPSRYTVRLGSMDPLRMGSTEYATVILRSIDVVSGQTTSLKEVRLQKGGVLQGRVRHARTGEPVAQVSVFVRLQSEGDVINPLSFISTDQDGYFEYRGVPDALIEVICKGQGFAPITQKGIRVRPGGEKTLHFSIDRGTEVSLRFQNIERADLSSLELEVEGPEGRIPLGLLGAVDLFGMSLPIDEPGVLPLGSFAPGDYSIRGRFRGRDFAQDVTLQGEERRVIDVSVPK